VNRWVRSRLAFVLLLLACAIAPSTGVRAAALSDSGSSESCVTIGPASGGAVTAGQAFKVVCVYTTTGYTSGPNGVTRGLAVVPGPTGATGTSSIYFRRENFAAWAGSNRSNLSSFDVTSTVVNPPGCTGARCVIFNLVVNNPADVVQSWPPQSVYAGAGALHRLSYDGNVLTQSITAAYSYSTNPGASPEHSFGTAAYAGLPAPPAMTCSRFWNNVSDTEIEIRYVVGFGLVPPVPTAVTYSVAYSTAGVVAGPVIEATLGKFKQRVTMDRANPRTVATITAAHPEFNPSTSTCRLLVDERLPDVSDPDSSVDEENDSFGCPTGWGILNPTNGLKMLKCLFIPRPSVADEVLGTDPVDDAETLGSDLDDTSVYYPVALAGEIGLQMVDQVVVDDIGTCQLRVSWGVSHIGYTGSPADGLPNLGSGAPYGLGPSLVDTHLCPAGSPWRTGVNLVRTVSFIAACTAALWMCVRFVKELGAYKSGPGAP